MMMTRRGNSMRERNQTGRDQDRNAYKKETPAIMKRRRWATKHYPLSLFLFGLFGYVSISRKGFMYLYIKNLLNVSRKSRRKKMKRIAYYL